MQDVISLTEELVRIPSVSQSSNEAVSEVIEVWLRRADFELERLTYLDEAGVRKVSLVARKGRGQGGLGFFSHSDTVPGAEAEWPAFDPTVRDGKLYGRGSCDMKGPLAATMLAAASVPASSLKRPVYIVVAADEENGFGGAMQIASESRLLKEHGWPEMAVIAEPSELIPIYAHKGGYITTVTARGRAAHSSTDLGVSSNFLIAAFLAEMAALKERFMREPEFRDPDFEPPTNGFNMTISDGDCAGNVTAAQTVCRLGFRSMPGVDNQMMQRLIVERAEHYGFEVESRGLEPFYTSPDAPIIQLSLQVTGAERAVTVPYGTEALVYHPYLPLVILGPGNIAQAHTVGEWIDVAQLERAVTIYREMLERFCCRA